MQQQTPPSVVRASETATTSSEDLVLIDQKVLKEKVKEIDKVVEEIYDLQCKRRDIFEYHESIVFRRDRAYSLLNSLLDYIFKFPNKKDNIKFLWHLQDPLHKWIFSGSKFINRVIDTNDIELLEYVVNTADKWGVQYCDIHAIFPKIKIENHSLEFISKLFLFPYAKKWLLQDDNTSPLRNLMFAHESEKLKNFIKEAGQTFGKSDDSIISILDAVMDYQSEFVIPLTYLLKNIKDQAVKIRPFPGR
jgi:hypothetical protein